MRGELTDSTSRRSDNVNFMRFRDLYVTLLSVARASYPKTGTDFSGPLAAWRARSRLVLGRPKRPQGGRGQRRFETVQEDPGRRPAARQRPDGCFGKSK